jgi:hypothetical protein
MILAKSVGNLKALSGVAGERCGLGFTPGPTYSADNKPVKRL